MYNRSPYLARYRVLNIAPSSDSRYILRRNQIAYGLSTAESVSEILKLKKRNQLSDELIEKFLAFQKRPEPDTQ